MAEYIMMIGLPGSGKSFWINQFLEKTNEEYKLVSSDAILEEWAVRDGITYNDSFQKYAKAAMKEMNRRFKEYVSNGDNIIHDQTNMSVKSRKGKLAIAGDHDKTAVVFIITDVLHKERLKMREGSGKDIPAFVLRNMSASYNAPTAEEGFTKIIEVRE